MPTYYLDYELGNDANDGSDWANAWKTLTLGATAARIAPGDIIRIAKSPAPTSVGNGTWTNLSKTVTLAAAQNLTIDLCETAWTGAGDTTIARTAVATDGKEGSFCMKLTVDSSPQASILQAYFATGELNLSAYQKISFWIKNSGAIVTNNWIVNLCSDVAGVTTVDSFLVPAIPSANRWLPLTLTKVGGGNLGASIKSIAIYSGSDTTGMASKFIYVDNFIACTTSGLNLQSLISKNSLEQGGTEGWYAIQSINGVTVLIDNETNTKGNAGQGYSTSGTSPETVTTYKRETIKTNLAASGATVVQQIMDSGSLGSNIEFQGGYNVSTNIQEGETYFDGLNGQGYGIYATAKSYTTLNYLNVYRYLVGINYAGSYSNNDITNVSNISHNTSYGIYYSGGHCNKITTLSNVNNNGAGAGAGVYYGAGRYNTIITLSNANGNLTYGVQYDGSSHCTIITLSNANNNTNSGVCFGSTYNIITVLSNANNNNQYGVYYGGNDNVVRSLSTTGNTIAGVYASTGPNYLSNALMAEATKISAVIANYTNYRFYCTNYQQDVTQHWVFTDGGSVNSLATDRVGGTGIMWKLAITSVIRDIYYPLKLSVARIAVVANKLVTVKIWMKKDHATNIGGKLVCSGGQLTGMSVTDITATKANDTNWEQLEISFTPSQQGVVECEVWAFYLLANGNIFCEDMEISQAD